MEKQKQSNGVWLNQMQSKAGKTFWRSSNVFIQGKECQLRAHQTGTGKLVLHFDPPYDREVKLELGE